MKSYRVIMGHDGLMSGAQEVGEEPRMTPDDEYEYEFVVEAKSRMAAIHQASRMAHEKFLASRKPLG